MWKEYRKRGRTVGFRVRVQGGINGGQGRRREKVSPKAERFPRKRRGGVVFHGRGFSINRGASIRCNRAIGAHQQLGIHGRFAALVSAAISEGIARHFSLSFFLFPFLGFLGCLFYIFFSFSIGFDDQELDFIWNFDASSFGRKFSSFSFLLFL